MCFHFRVLWFRCLKTKVQLFKCLYIMFCCSVAFTKKFCGSNEFTLKIWNLCAFTFQRNKTVNYYKPSKKYALFLLNPKSNPQLSTSQCIKQWQITYIIVGEFSFIKWIKRKQIELWDICIQILITKPHSHQNHHHQHADCLCILINTKSQYSVCLNLCQHLMSDVMQCTQIRKQTSKLWQMNKAFINSDILFPSQFISFASLRREKMHASV